MAYSLDNLASLARQQGQGARSERLYRQALAIREKSLGPDHLNVAVTLDGLAALYRSRGDTVRAAPLQQRVLAIREKARGPGAQALPPLPRD